MSMHLSSCTALQGHTSERTSFLIPEREVWTWGSSRPWLKAMKASSNTGGRGASLAAQARKPLSCQHLLSSVPAHLSRSDIKCQSRGPRTNQQRAPWRRQENSGEPVQSNHPFLKDEKLQGSNVTKRGIYEFLNHRAYGAFKIGSLGHKLNFCHLCKYPNEKDRLTFPTISPREQEL